MNSISKVFSLREIILNTLSCMIQNDYWLLEVPYYTNIGDVLIWQGEMDFLRRSKHHCKGMYSLQTFNWPRIRDDELILFQGGGNFGDLWTKHHEFKMRVMEAYPRNRYIFFPQTVYFEHEENLAKCAARMSKFTAVICARDSQSYETLRRYFTNEVLLVPDMAFCIETDNWHSGCGGERSLLLKRKDKELKICSVISRLETEANVDVSDWDTFENTDVFTRNLYRLQNRPYLSRIQDWYARYIYRPHLINSGIRLLSKYNEIFTTRLHAAILGVLLGKRVHMIDNSYGKNRQFYECWLSDVDSVDFLG